MAYAAIVTKIQVKPHPNADKLAIGTCMLATGASYQVIVGKDTEDGALGLFFEQGGQLSDAFLAASDLVKRKNDDGTPAGGMFEPNGRVRAIKLRGETSEGFWCPLAYLFNLEGGFTAEDFKDMKVGEEFSQINATEICRKYVTPATRREIERAARAGGPARRENDRFHKHFDTHAWKQNIHHVQPGVVVYVTEKLHGTSHRFGRVLEEWQPANWRNLVKKFIARLAIRIATGCWKRAFRYKVLHGTRNTILGQATNTYSGDETFRIKAVGDAANLLAKGETVYGEIVGYAGPQAHVMAKHDLTKLQDKTLVAQFGESTGYTYGCAEGEARFYVYRITRQNEDDIVTELSWPQVQKRAGELGLAVVPLLFGPFAVDAGASESYVKDQRDAIAVEADFYANDVEETASTLDAGTLREGVCVRVESSAGVRIFKHKSKNFGILEGYLKDDETIVDREEAA